MRPRHATFVAVLVGIAAYLVADLGILSAYERRALGVKSMVFFLWLCGMGLMGIGAFWFRRKFKRLRSANAAGSSDSGNTAGGSS